MKKTLLVILAAMFFSAPALVIYYSMHTSAVTMRAENEKQLLHRMQQELQRQDILVNPVIEIYRKLFMALRRTRQETWTRRQNEVGDELLDFLKSLMYETTKIHSGGESSLIYRRHDQDHEFAVKNGQALSESLLAYFLRILRRVQQNRDSAELRHAPQQEISELIKNELKIYFNNDILYEDGDGDKIQRVVVREPGSYRLFMLLRLRLAFIMNFIIDLTDFDTNARARQKIDNWQNQYMGLAFLKNQNADNIIASSYFANRQMLQNILPRLVYNSGERSGLLRWRNYLLVVSSRDPQKPHRTIIAAEAPPLPKNPGMLMLTIFFGILGCFIFKIFVERIIFERGGDVSIMMFILAIFILVTMLPLLSSTYLANEYVAANFRREKNRAVEELADELVSLDIETLANFRDAVNYARSLDSIEKLAAFTGLPVTTSINELVLQTVRKSYQLNGRPFFTSVWVYDESQPFFSVVYDRETNDYRFTKGRNPVAEEMFTNRYRAYMKLDISETEAQTPARPTNDIEFDTLKAELLDSFFLNMFGDRTYYQIREDFGTLIWQKSFMDTNAMLTVPITLQGKKTIILTWIFESSGIRDQFPEAKLRTETNNPLFVIFGNDQYIGAQPESIPELTRDFPALVKLGNQALVTSSRVFMQDYTASGAPIFEARPARHSDMIMCGSKTTRSLESITRELVSEALRYFIYIAAGGISLALLTSLYFTIPLRQLTNATRQIADGNYEVRLDQNHPDEFAIAAGAFNQMATGLQQGELLSSFVSESVKELASREQLSITDIARNTSATVLFSSIRDFQSIQQQHDPQRTFELLQAHLSAAVAAVEQYGGEIDKMIEDKVMIVFENRQQNEHKQVDAAIATAIAIKNAIQKDYSLQTAAGITSGEVVSGVMGAGNVRLSKTVVGDTVNLAARLAAVAAGLPDGGIVASGSTVEKMSDDYLCEKLPISRVKGKTHTVEAFSVSRKTV
ncbi:MAG: adenylate/guanylate cyclase domain-containing protein [Candidatus Riflebacteria bacterium]|nr:adenylate/guanylate cyclase domain-containing protein [Candidatus Riflebacteria bacterium]